MELDEWYEGGPRVFTPRDWYIDDAIWPVPAGTHWETGLGTFIVTRTEKVGDKYRVYGVRED